MATSSIQVGFVGLGTMGSRLASRIANSSTKSFKVVGYDKYIAKSNPFLSNIKICDDINDCFHESNYIMTCLPTTNDVNDVVNQFASFYNDNNVDITRNPIWLDCTSGSALDTQKLGTQLYEQHKIHFLDCPVSGGVMKAENGNLACMVGCNDNSIYQECLPLLSCFASFIEHVGNLGSGHAIKSINNLINISNLLILTEGIELLSNNFGNENKTKEEKINLLKTALNVIDHSSGRSLMSSERWPKNIIDGKYNYDFMLGLMLKDVRNALKLKDNNTNKNSNNDENESNLRIAPIVEQLLQQSVEKYGYNADYTEAVKMYFDIHSDNKEKENLQ